MAQRSSPPVGFCLLVTKAWRSSVTARNIGDIALNAYVFRLPSGPLYMRRTMVQNATVQCQMDSALPLGRTQKGELHLTEWASDPFPWPSMALLHIPLPTMNFPSIPDCSPSRGEAEWGGHARQAWITVYIVHGGLWKSPLSICPCPHSGPHNPFILIARTLERWSSATSGDSCGGQPGSLRLEYTGRRGPSPFHRTERTIERLSYPQLGDVSVIRTHGSLSPGTSFVHCITGFAHGHADEAWQEESGSWLRESSDCIWMKIHCMRRRKAPEVTQNATKAAPIRIRLYGGARGKGDIPVLFLEITTTGRSSPSFK
ncbi:hypothetical protein BXZ70DRAFT_910966 [Cristinia sonorae]|uniref:Uncharacterized protein n=1 Tax=Cristinia sonorae TaxID=1940300 RepID=A0A8K0UE21_9AGAR|nr:hypothetical protein BXZ70DRAFT_910966 [Cristinia sonorae]